jgi:dihydrofolate synthase / folylpolyglutamate synthase
LTDRALADWLKRLERRSPESRIDLGLDRVRTVFSRLAPRQPDCPVITVAGTNGKGSVVAMLEAMVLAAGLKPFAFSSPHLLEFGERMRVAGEPASAADIVAALESVEHARGDIALTYFEQVTLAALALAREARPDVMLLEVGLGGRLDAVNVIDADVAVITSIGLDHTDWLGPTRADIAREKAGVARPGRPVIVGERRRPPALDEVLQGIGAMPVMAGQQLKWRCVGECLRIAVDDHVFRLQRPAMAGSWQANNAACAVAALTVLGDRLEVDEAAMSRGLASARLPGRFQCLSEAPAVYVDVAHNGAAARELARALGVHAGRSFAVFSALGGKDIKAIGRVLDASFSDWLVAGIDGERGMSAAAIDAELARIPVSGRRETVESVPRAVELALERAGVHDRIVVFGSFRTVAEAWPTLIQQG